MKRKGCKGNKGQFAIVFIFIITAVVCTVIFAGLAPLGARMNSELYAIGDLQIRAANSTISAIEDDNVRNNLTAMFGSALDASEENIRVNTDLYKYSAYIVIGIIAIVLFLYARQLVEVGGGYV